MLQHKQYFLARFFTATYRETYRSPCFRTSRITIPPFSFLRKLERRYGGGSNISPNGTADGDLLRCFLSQMGSSMQRDPHTRTMVSIGTRDAYLLFGAEGGNSGFTVLSRAVVTGPVSPVLAGPLFLMAKIKPILQIASNKQKS